MSIFSSNIPENWRQIIWPIFVFLATLILGLILRKIIFERLINWSKRTQTDMDDIIINALRRPLIIWGVMLALYLAMRISSLPEHLISLATKILLVLMTL